MSEACLILAAGAGARLGGRNKALLPYGESSFLGTIAQTVLGRSGREIWVVVADPFESETRAHHDSLAVRWISNPEPARGMASSVALGFAHLLRESQCSRVWLWPVDTPGVSPQTLQRVAGSRHPLALPCHRDRGGHPILVARQLWTRFAECDSLPQGARSVVRSLPSTEIDRVDVNDPRIHWDVDYPVDVERFA